MTTPEIIQVHKHSIRHKREMEASSMCGCFYCLEIFSPTAIEEWIERERTAIYPKCSIDSVIGDTSVTDLCNELRVKPVTLYRYVDPNGNLRDYGNRVLGNNA